jgi:hypothetical protein
MRKWMIRVTQAVKWTKFVPNIISELKGSHKHIPRATLTEFTVTDQYPIKETPNPAILCFAWWPR